MPDGSKILREPQEQVAYQRGPRRLERLTASCSSGPEKANRAKAAQTFGSSIKGGQTPCTTRRTIATNSRGNPGAPAQPALRRKSSDPDKENPLRDKSRLRPPPRTHPRFGGGDIGGRLNTFWVMMSPSARKTVRARQDNQDPAKTTFGGLTAKPKMALCWLF